MNRRQFIKKGSLLIPVALAFPAILKSSQFNVLQSPTRFITTGSTLFNVPGVPDVLPPTNAWYKLDEGFGTTAHDSTSNGRDGILTNSPTWITGPNSNGALAFNSSSSKYVACGTDLGLGGQTANMTITLWADTGGSGHGAFFKLGNITGSGGGDGFAIGIGGTGGSVGFENAGTTLLGLYEGISWMDSALTIGSGWNFYAIIIDGSGNCTLWVNATVRFTQTNGLTMLAIGSIGISTAQIGGYESSAPTNRYFTGNVDDVRIYNSALNSTQLAALLAQGAQ